MTVISASRGVIATKDGAVTECSAIIRLQDGRAHRGIHEEENEQDNRITDNVELPEHVWLVLEHRYADHKVGDKNKEDQSNGRDCRHEQRCVVGLVIQRTSKIKCVEDVERQQSEDIRDSLEEVRQTLTECNAHSANDLE